MRTQNAMVSLFRRRLLRVQVRHVTDRWLAVALACLAGRGRRFLFLQTRIAIPQYFSQSYGAYFKHIVRTCTCTCAYTYCKCLRDVNDILRHIKIRAIWLAEMQSSFAEKKIARGRGPAARGQSVHGSVYCAYKWGVSQTDDSPSLIGLTPWRTMWSVCSRLRLLRVQLWGVSQTNDLPLINQQPLIQIRYL